MKDIIKNWNEGWTPALNSIVYYIVLAIYLLPLAGLKYLLEENGQMTIIKVFIFMLAIFIYAPLAFYWTSKGTNLLKTDFREIKDEPKKDENL